LGCAVVSKTCDNEDTTASLGNSEPLSVKNPPISPIPHVGQRLDEAAKVFAVRGGQYTRDILPYNPSWLDTLNQLKVREHNSASIISEAGALPCDAEGLARSSSDHNVGCSDFDWPRRLLI
jgi:hypothetical protein